MFFLRKGAFTQENIGDVQENDALLEKSFKKHPDVSSTPNANIDTNRLEYLASREGTCRLQNGRFCERDAYRAFGIGISPYNCQLKWREVTARSFKFDQIQNLF